MKVPVLSTGTNGPAGVIVPYEDSGSNGWCVTEVSGDGIGLGGLSSRLQEAGNIADAVGRFSERVEGTRLLT